jgi:PTH2 family peptidyl-tRNA hydrolase
MYKQAIVIRTDLKMGVGKLCVQCCHASVGAMKKADWEVVSRWEGEGGKKVVLQVDSLRKLKRLWARCQAAGLPSFLVVDRGLTQLRRGTVTGLGVGPAEESRIDRITGKLKLL